MFNMRRVWAMPSGDTFDIPQIHEIVWKYLRPSQVSVDPFARNKRWATYTNDLNPATQAEYHMDSRDFLVMLYGNGVKPDVVLFDPPYSASQIKELYDGIGLKVGWQAQRTANWTAEKDLLYKMMPVGSYFVYLNWDTNGMGIGRDFAPVEGLVICHGAGHHDTLLLVEQKQVHQMNWLEGDAT